MLVAAVMTLAAPVSVSVVDFIEYGNPLEFAHGFIGVPSAVWGPALGIATLAHWLRRSREARAQGRTLTIRQLVADGPDTHAPTPNLAGT